MGQIISTETDDKSKEPWWINPVYKFGIPSAICIFLVWFLTAQVKADLAEIKLNVAYSKSLIESNLEVNKRMIQILQRICINSATSNQERSECFQ